MLGYRYIGSKTKIVYEIISEIKKRVPAGQTVCDLMCGTGAISLELRKNNYRVISVDVMSQACHITNVKVNMRQAPHFRNVNEINIANGQTLLIEKSRYESIIQTLNNLEPVKEYFWKEFSPDGMPKNGEEPRKYFSSENAQKIDAARKFIKKLNQEDVISNIEHSLLIHDLIVSANDAANIAGTYGHYLSKLVPRALQSLKFYPTKFERGGIFTEHKVINDYAENAARKISAYLCYIDPPYMKRQYAANYHLLETLAKEDEPVAVGKSGLRPWRDQYSDFCSKRKIRNAFEKIFTGMKCNHFLISYNSEGLLSKKELCEFLQNFGQVTIREFPNKRFKSRNEQAIKSVAEYLLYLKTSS